MSDWDYGYARHSSHNLAEVIDATVYMIDHPTAKVDNLIEFCLGQTSQELSSKGVTK